MPMIVKRILDNGGRRSGIERRQMVYNVCLPERRCDSDRRQMPDRRNGIDRRSGIDRRETFHAEPTVLEMRSGKDRRNFRERRAAFA